MLTVYIFSIFDFKEHNQSDFGIDHLVMSMCRIVSCDLFVVFSCFINLFICNWRIIALQYCVGFCHTTMLISHRYITLQPSIPYHPSRLSQSSKFELPASSSIFHWLIIGHFLKNLKFVVICYRSQRKTRKLVYTEKCDKHETP